MSDRLTVKAYSHYDFDKMCERNGWTDSNVEALNNIAIISIICSKECQKYYLDEIEKHWFNSNHSNVLNIEFDDLNENVEYHGHIFRAMTDMQVQEIFAFIEQNIGKNFIIHCRAGQSRSVGICSFIGQMYQDKYDIVNKGQLTPNIHVLSLLKECYYKKYGYSFA